MDLTVQHEKDCVLAIAQGPVDETAKGLFQQCLHPLIEPGARLVVDLADSPRVNSQGLSALVLLKTNANTKQARLIYAAPSPFVAEVLRVSRLDTFFEMADSRADAIAQISQS